MRFISSLRISLERDSTLQIKIKLEQKIQIEKSQIESLKARF